MNETQQELILEYVKLVAESPDGDEIDDDTRGRLREIEHKLKMTPEAIFQAAAGIM